MTQTNAAINELSKLLETGDEAQRCYSARAITEAKITTVTPALNACLYHQDPDVVADAATALATVCAGDLDSLQDVAINHPDSDARLAALSAITKQYNNEPQRVVDTLTRFATGRTEEDDWGLSGGWDDWWDLQLTAVQLLSSIQTAQNNDLFSSLFIELLTQDPEPELELALYRALVDFQPQILLQHWTTARKMKQRRLARAFATSATTAALDHMAACLKCDDSEIKKIALKALATHGQTQNVQAYLADIIACLSDSEPSVQEAATSTLNQLNQLAALQPTSLMPFIKQAPDSSLPSLINLLSRQNDKLTTADIDWLQPLLTHSDSNIKIATINCFSTLSEAQVLYYSDVYLTALNSCLAAIQNRQLPLYQRAQLLRQLSQFKQHANLSFPVLKALLENDETDVALRQSALEAITSETNEDSLKWLTQLLLGLASQEDTIAITQIDDVDVGADVGAERSDSQPEKTAGRIKLEALLAAHGDKFPEDQGFDNAPVSTLAAIQQSNIEATLLSADDKPDDQTLLEMIDDLDDEFTAYSNIVRDHLDTSENLALNRKKIARLPQTDSKLLAIRALGHSKTESAAGLLIEAMLGATPKEQHELFQALTNIAKHHDYKVLRNGIGAAGYTLHYGDPLCKQSAAQFLTHMPLNKALPILLVGADDENEHVRVCCLTALKDQLESKRLLQRHQQQTCDIIAKKIHDPAGGVRKLALQILAKIDLSKYLPVLIELAVSDQESNVIAAPLFFAKQQESLAILTYNIAEYSDHRQPLAIQLAGRLLAFTA
ncbi:MAG: HEAT repeat domain-containing protein [Moritella sp.]|uniref:HEAT repeat domain-containing protein n=1 Tax=Moritella sp. PE36 TaxID=58051 RepID=UPI0001568F08|nr:HEAT repeat domain-containing protein [Moritella sp. PE36]EDM65618.1 hypothetical protein PE36_13364 [Moritella sp. PE36]PHR90157.1 MAG: HEAT repeat domain-containing protein [Moritella sp.]